MPDEELEASPQELPETPGDMADYAIRRVREVVAETRLVESPKAKPPEPEPPNKANIAWQLHVWSGPHKAPRRALGMSDMGGATDARPRDAARAKD